MHTERLEHAHPAEGSLATQLCGACPVNALSGPLCYKPTDALKRHTVRSVERRRRRKLRLAAH